MTTNGMCGKEQFDAFIKLAEFRLRRWNMRQSVEWKISVALWGLLVAALAGTIYIPEKPPLFWVAVVLLIVIFGHAFLWVGQIRVRNDNDQDMAFYYVEHAEHVLSPSLKPRERPAPVAGLKGGCTRMRLEG